MKYLVLYRDLLPSADGRSRSLGIFDYRTDAHAAILKDVAHYCDTLSDLPLVIEECENVVSVKMELDEYLCDWEIVTVAKTSG